MRLVTATMFAAAFALAGPAVAGEIADAGATAEQLAAEGKYADAMAALAAAQDQIWKQAPLSFRKTLFVASDPAGFGIYDIRDTSTFKRSEPLIIYSEPLGYGYGRDGQIYTIDLELDFAIKSPDGSEVASQKGFGTLSLRSRVPNKEFMAKVTYDFSGLQPGEYTVITTMHDKNSAKTGDFAMDFKLTE